MSESTEYRCEVCNKWIKIEDTFDAFKVNDTGDRVFLMTGAYTESEVELCKPCGEEIQKTIDKLRGV